ncbi:hypothetical protein [Novosphingobium sp.]|uniref:hypothetical protein n=1 Tax=Novosphingobium sp. TaxID=1874826 RepID=UPI002602F99A|nr:hypothetical protein [Novosphingobium sp.]
MTLTRTSLTPFARSMRDPDPAGARRVAQELYDEHGIVVIFPNDVAKVDAMWIEAIGKRLYGRRR